MFGYLLQFTTYNAAGRIRRQSSVMSGGSLRLLWWSVLYGVQNTMPCPSSVSDALIPKVSRES